MESSATTNAFYSIICILYRKRILGGVEFNLKLYDRSARLLRKRVNLTSNVLGGFFCLFLDELFDFRILVSPSR